MECKKIKYDEAVELFLGEVPASYTKVPCEDCSSLRLGGWLLKDENNMMIGFVSNNGSVTYHDYRDTVVGEDPSLLSRKRFIL